VYEKKQDIQKDFAGKPEARKLLADIGADSWKNILRIRMHVN
jgi:hypothetical protein